MEFFFYPARFVHKSQRPKAATGERGACRLRDQRMVREELGAKGFGDKYP